MKKLFEILSINKYYGKTRALDVSNPKKPIVIKRGSTTAILGLSGSGKSTLLSILNLTEEAGDGSKIIYNSDYDYSNLNKDQKEHLRKKNFGVSFQDGHLISHITTKTNIELSLSLSGADNIDKSIVSEKLIEELKLARRKSSRPKELSGGEYQRVAIARSLAHNPKVIFADEPTGNLDSDTSKVVMDMLNSWKNQSKDNSLILVTHNINQAIEYADNFIFMKDGNIVCTFTKDELSNKNKGQFRDTININKDLVNEAALYTMLDTSQSSSENIDFPKWNKKSSLLNTVKFYFEYAFRDLFPVSFKNIFNNFHNFKQSLKDTTFTFLTVFSLTLLIAMTTLGVNIYSGIQEYLNLSSKNDIRLNRLIIETKTGATEKDMFTDTMLDSLGIRLSKVTKEPTLINKLLGINDDEKSVEGIYGITRGAVSIFTHKGDSISEVEYDDFHNQHECSVKIKTDDEIYWSGSTVNPNSKLLKKLSINGKNISSTLIENTSTNGIIIKKSQYDKYFCTRQDSILIIPGMGSLVGERKNIKILAVVDDLPDGDFIIAPHFFKQIRDAGLGIKYTNFKFSVNFSKLDIPPELVKMHFDNIKERYRHQFGETKITIELKDNLLITSFKDIQENKLGYKKDWWNEKLGFLIEQCNKELKKQNYKAINDFDESIVERNFIGEKNTVAITDLEYNYAAVYLTDMSRVKEISDIVTSYNDKLEIDPYVVNISESMYQTKQISILIFAVVMLCVVILSFSNLFLMFRQSILRKRHEIGILKALGSRKIIISFIYFIEGFYLWIISLLLGVIIGHYSGNAISTKLIDIFNLSHKFPLYSFNSYVIGLLSLLILLVCILITYSATSQYSKLSANELLRQRD